LEITNLIKPLLKNYAKYEWEISPSIIKTKIGEYTFTMYYERVRDYIDNIHVVVEIFNVKISTTDGVISGLEIETSDRHFKKVKKLFKTIQNNSPIFKNAMNNASPVLLEPIMKVVVDTPEENMGDVIGDMNRRRGQLLGMDSRAGAQVIKATVPLSEMFGYVTQLRTITSGRATSTMEFDHYAEAPRNVQEEVVAKAKGKKAAANA